MADDFIARAKMEAKKLYSIVEFFDPSSFVQGAKWARTISKEQLMTVAEIIYEERGRSLEEDARAAFRAIGFEVEE